MATRGYDKNLSEKGGKCGIFLSIEGGTLKKYINTSGGIFEKVVDEKEKNPEETTPGKKTPFKN
jgi:hypothetical protein